MTYMKRLLAIIAILTSVAMISLSCGKNEVVSSGYENNVVYEMNVRQLTPEGTFAAAAEKLPMLKSIGVDIVWLMPIHPIGVLERKGTLGSYYSPKDYRAVNPEYGTLEDFDAFVAKAHSLGLKVIIDWVANHTSPDSEWAVSHPEWFLRDENGRFIVQHDWTDIAPLDLSNEDMRAEMRDNFRFWLSRGIDGFRCDVAGEMPFEYWESMISPMRKEFPGKYWLAEGEHPEHHTISDFDASYSWELHHLLNAIAQGKKGITDLVAYIKKNAELYPADAMRLAFTSNHDENAWKGTEFERMGDAWKAMTVLCWTLPQTQPLIYTGQEIGYDHRFLFFEKDPMPQVEENEFTAFYRYLASLKHSHPALDAAAGQEFNILSTDNNTLKFERISGKDKVTVSVQLAAPWDWSVEVGNL